MKGEIEVHFRDIVYWVSGIFSGFAVKYSVNKLVFGETDFFSKQDHGTEILYFVVLIPFFSAQLVTNIYVDKNQNYIDVQRFRRKEWTVLLSVDLFVILLLVTAIQKP